MTATVEIYENDSVRRRFVESVVDALKRTGTIGRATFIKKDGSKRNMRFMRAMSQNYVAVGSDSAARRDVNNPHLLRLIDLDVYRKAKKAGADKQAAMKAAFRTLNALTCLEIKAHGVLYRLN
jgi:hypothetical protein